MKEDGREIGRTRASKIDANNAGMSTVATTTATTSEEEAATNRMAMMMMIGKVSWENQAAKFEVALAGHHRYGGGLPLQLVFEIWEISGRNDDEFYSGDCPPRDEEENEEAHDIATAVSSRCRLLASASVSPGTLVLSEPGRLSLPLLRSTGSTRSSASASAEARGTTTTTTGGRKKELTTEKEKKEEEGQTKKSGKKSPRPSEIVLRVTPQVGLDWGRRAMTAAAAAKRTLLQPPPPRCLPHTPDQDSTSASISPPQPSVAKQSKDGDDEDDEPTKVSAVVEEIDGGGPRVADGTNPRVSVAVGKSDGGDPRVDENPNSRVSVVYMTNAEGSARTWHAPVTPGDSIPRISFEDVLELTYASLPACCPRARSLAVAPFSDIGVRLGKLWVGPRVTSRHAIVIHRPRPAHQPPRAKSRGDGNGKKEEEQAAGFDDVAESPREDELFMRTVAAEAERLLREIRAESMRVEQRRVALTRVHEICGAWDRTRSREAAIKDGEDEKKGAEHGGGMKGVGSADNVEEVMPGAERKSDGGGEGDRGRHPSGGDEHEDEEDGHDGDDHASGHAYGDLYRRVLRALEIALPGVSVYLGLLNSGGQTIRYVACTRTSSMAGRELKRGEGVSFSCVGPRHLSSVIYPPRRRDRVSAGGKNGHEDKQQSCGRDNPAASQTKEHGPAHKGKTPPVVERSLEEGAVILQKAFRGKLNRDRLALERQHLSSGTLGTTGTTGAGDDAQRDAPAVAVVAAGKAVSAASIPKVFDYNGHVGWPFVCVPVEGHLGSSSIGVVGMDTFEQMGNSQSEGVAQPEAGVVRMVSEAARYDRRQYYGAGGGEGGSGVTFATSTTCFLAVYIQTSR